MRRLLSAAVCSVLLLGAVDASPRTVRMPRLSLRSIEVSGAHDPVVVQRTLRTRLPNVRACYKALLVNAPGFWSDVPTRLRIEATQTGNVDATSAPNHPGLDRCIERALTGVTVAGPADPSTVQLTLRLRPE